MISALGARLSQAPALPSASPRPALGVFTSLRVTGGRCCDLDAHLERLEVSTKKLFGKPLPPALNAELTTCLASCPSGRLRITTRPAGGLLRVSVEVVPAGVTPATAALRPFPLFGGLGAHKWQDRRLVNEAGAGANLGPGEQLLIVDTGNEVLETDRANIFAIIGGVVRTPSAGGRLLPGITRAAVLMLAEQADIMVEEGPLWLGELAHASEIFLTNSVHGIIPVRSVSGAASSTGPMTPRLRAALDRRPDAVSPGLASTNSRRASGRCGTMAAR